MTTTEKIENLAKSIETLKRETQSKQELLSKEIKEASENIHKAKSPAHLEVDILRAAQAAIGDSISKVLTNYDSPLTKLVASVVSENAVELRAIISSSFSQVIRTEDFKQSIINAFSHKVARTIISNNDGLFDKVSNDLKQDTIFKSKMSLAVAAVVEECLKGKN